MYIYIYVCIHMYISVLRRGPTSGAPVPNQIIAQNVSIKWFL